MSFPSALVNCKQSAAEFKYASVANSISKRLLIVFGNYYYIYYDALFINAYFWIQRSNNFWSQFYFQCLTGIIFKKAIVISWHSIQFPEQLGWFVILTCKLICGITFQTCKLVCGVTSRRTGILHQIFRFVTGNLKLPRFRHNLSGALDFVLFDLWKYQIVHTINMINIIL